MLYAQAHMRCARTKIFNTNAIFVNIRLSSCSTEWCTVYDTFITYKWCVFCAPKHQNIWCVYVCVSFIFFCHSLSNSSLPFRIFVSLTFSHLHVLCATWLHSFHFIVYFVFATAVSAGCTVVSCTYTIFSLDVAFTNNI